jgi:hypothetical protein
MGTSKTRLDNRSATAPALGANDHVSSRIYCDSGHIRSRCFPLPQYFLPSICTDICYSSSIQPLHTLFILSSFPSHTYCTPFASPPPLYYLSSSTVHTPWARNADVLSHQQRAKTNFLMKVVNLTVDQIVLQHCQQLLVRGLAQPFLTVFSKKAP